MILGDPPKKTAPACDCALENAQERDQVRFLLRRENKAKSVKEVLRAKHGFWTDGRQLLPNRVASSGNSLAKHR